MKRFWANALAIFILFSLVSVAGKGLFQYSVFQTHDLKHHISRSFDAVLAISEGHFPLRWAGTMNYECGLPLFNFYYPLLYYLVVGINFFAGSLLFSLKIVSFLSFLTGTLFFYLWMKEETDDIWASLAGAVLYLYAPYRFLLIYVRGSPEYLSYAILPIVLLFFAKAFKEKSDLKFIFNVFLAAVFGGLLAISHNIVSLFLMPIILLYLIIKFIQNKKMGIKRTLLIIFSYISAFGLGAFFIFPALLEEKFTKISIPIFNYQHHFPTLTQVIRSKWGYGDSAIGESLDAMSFQLGYAHWIVLAIVALWLLYSLAKVIILRKSDVKKFLFENIYILMFFFLSLTFLFLVLPISLPVWDKIKLLQAIQFSWRLLGICVFTISAVFVFLAAKIKTKFLYWFLITTTALIAVIGNRNHILPQPILENDLPLYVNLDKLTFPRRELPGYAETVLPPSASSGCYTATPVVSTDFQSEKIVFKEVERGSTFGIIDFKIEKKKNIGQKIILNLSYFPDMYDFEINSKSVEYLDCGGRACFEISGLEEGNNIVKWRVGQTKIQKLFNGITLGFLILWIYIMMSMIFRRKND